MTKYYDISLTITNNLPTWPGDPTVQLERVEKIEDGANANVSQLSLSVHTGTHVDAPYHFIPGAGTVETLPLDILIGPVQVVELPDEIDVIHRQTVQSAGIQPGAVRVLFKTRNSRYWSENAPGFQTQFVGIDEEGSKALVELGVRLVGIDYLSIAPYKQSRPTHLAMLGAGMIAVEGVDLSQVSPGVYELVCLPLKLGGSDGAPARAVLIDRQG